MRGGSGGSRRGGAGLLFGAKTARVRWGRDRQGQGAGPSPARWSRLFRCSRCRPWTGSWLRCPAGRRGAVAGRDGGPRRPGRPPPRQIRAEGLCCDYRILFPKAEADEIFQQLEEEVQYFEGDLTKLHIFGTWHNIPRKQVTYGDPELSYTYSGVTFHPKPWIPVLNRIRERVIQATGHTFNFVLINRYKDGLDHIGEHRDDERELVPRSPIASVSFGACRDFIFRHRDCRKKGVKRGLERIKLELAHGSLLMMNYPTNVYWYHSLPPRRRVITPRVNLTFRKVMVGDRKSTHQGLLTENSFIS